MPRKSPYIIELSDQERKTLEAQAHRYTLPDPDVVPVAGRIRGVAAMQRLAIGYRLFEASPSPVPGNGLPQSWRAFQTSWSRSGVQMRGQSTPSSSSHTRCTLNGRQCSKIGQRP
jgi:hypothetical protein